MDSQVCGSPLATASVAALPETPRAPPAEAAFDAEAPLLLEVAVPGRAPVIAGEARGRPERLPLPVVEVWAMHLSVLLVSATGLVYAWLRYLATPGDPYGVVSRPWQPAVQHVHLLVAPLLVFAVGLIWRRHVWCGWRQGIRARRRSGLATALSLVPMVASGYLLQAAVEDAWRRAWGWVHLATGLLWIAGYVAHLLLPRTGAARDFHPRARRGASSRRVRSPRSSSSLTREGDVGPAADLSPWR